MIEGEGFPPAEIKDRFFFLSSLLLLLLRLV